MNGWDLAYDVFEPAEERRREALCTLGNGYFATRGAAPEADADDVHYPGTYIAGCYNRLRDDVAGHEVDNESLVNMPNWLPLTFRVDGGEWFDLGRVTLLDYRQELDLLRGVLTRLVRCRDDSGRHIQVSQRRFVHMEQPHLAGLETTITAENWTGRLSVRSGLDGSVRNTGVERYRDLAGQHLSDVECGAQGDLLVLTAATSQSRVAIAMAARTRLWRDDRVLEVSPRVVHGSGRVAHEVEVDVAPGSPVTVEKVVSVYTSRDPAVAEPREAALTWLARADDFDALLERHVLAWDQLWQLSRADLTAAGDAPAATMLATLRLHLFHLLQTVSAHSRDLDVGVPARGLHGEAYRGHIFWDELFVFPVLTIRAPALTRALLRYRHRRLPEARRAARECGYTGAMYPWQSGSDGREESQRLHLNPLSGHWMADVSHRQRHAGSAVAFTMWQYYESTGDLEFLADYGAEAILEIARFWSSIATYDRARDRYVIRGVVGPDEFHTGYPAAPSDGVDNNAYTNVMAVWVILRALDTLSLLPSTRRDQLVQRLGLRPEERERWHEITRKMFVPFQRDGVISQFEGFQELKELDWDAYGRRYPNMQRLDRILEAEGQDVNGYRVSKQADVLMLFYLLSAEELREILGGLGYPLDHDSIPRTVEYYLARTSHGSTLSSLVHAWVLARAHRERALDFLHTLLLSDVGDIQGGTTAEGIHLAAMAGSVDLLQRCLTGLEMRGDVLRFNPRWPAELGVLDFTMTYRGCQLTVTLSATSLRLSAEPGPGSAVRVICGGQVRDLAPGDAAQFDLAALPFAGPAPV